MTGCWPTLLLCGWIADYRWSAVLFLYVVLLDLYWDTGLRLSLRTLCKELGFELFAELQCALNSWHNSSLLRGVAWCRTGDEPLPEIRITHFPNHTCIPMPQWIHSDESHWRCKKTNCHRWLVPNVLTQPFVSSQWRVKSVFPEIIFVQWI